jgi:hypothetical protein
MVTSRTHPPTEYASGAVHFIDGWRSLAERTGLPPERIAELGMTGNLDVLFRDGRLLPGVELRALDHAEKLGPTVETRTLRRRIDEVTEKRYPKVPLNPHQALLDAHRKRADATDALVAAHDRRHGGLP